ncbi:unnamed protein product, partial [Staurois parvus]
MGDIERQLRWALICGIYVICQRTQCTGDRRAARSLSRACAVRMEGRHML